MLLSGREALNAVAKILPTAETIRVSAGAMGEVALVPGSVWSNGEKMLVYAGPLQIYFTKGNDLYEGYTPNFVRDEWLTAFSKGSARAEYWIPIAKAEFALIQALLVPTW